MKVQRDLCLSSTWCISNCVKMHPIFCPEQNYSPVRFTIGFNLCCVDWSYLFWELSFLLLFLSFTLKINSSQLSSEYKFKKLHCIDYKKLQSHSLLSHVNQLYYDATTALCTCSFKAPIICLAASLPLIPDSYVVNSSQNHICYLYLQRYTTELSSLTGVFTNWRLMESG